MLGGSRRGGRLPLSLLEMLDAVGAELLEPRLFLVEVVGVLVRYIGPGDIARALALLERSG